MNNEEMIIQLRLYVAGIRHADCLEAKAQRYGQALGYIKAMDYLNGQSRLMVACL